MTPRTIAVLSPGDMGHSVANVLRHGGYRLVTCLQGRSARTAALAREAGCEALADYATLVREADVVLSVLAPASAGALADLVAAALRETGATPLFVECNAIAPQTVREIAAVITAAGGRVIDGGIIGQPPRPEGTRTRLYVSGAEAVELLPLTVPGLEVRVVGPAIGQASGLKMCYAALTKGLTALATELLVAGEQMGLAEPLHAELSDSQGTLLRWIEQTVPRMPPKAYRWVGETEEIAATFAHVGLTPRILDGAADMYRFVGETPLRDETPEQRTRGQSLAEVVAILAESLPGARAAAGSAS
jgi:3-hydroxyisobutyrate dehydrogenase-like beta-hydroxyacid dehydrogenase